MRVCGLQTHDGDPCPVLRQADPLVGGLRTGHAHDPRRDVVAVSASHLPDAALPGLHVRAQQLQRRWRRGPQAVHRERPVRSLGHACGWKLASGARYHARRRRDAVLEDVLRRRRPGRDFAPLRRHPHRRRRPPGTFNRTNLWPPGLGESSDLLHGYYCLTDPREAFEEPLAAARELFASIGYKSALPAFHGSGLAAIERTKANGDDPTHGATAAGRRTEANITRKRQARDWDEQHGKLVDLSGFERDILPLIQDVSLSRLQKATGPSLRYVSLNRRGDRTPHPRHWQTLIEAADGRAQFSGDAEALAKRDS